MPWSSTRVEGNGNGHGANRTLTAGGERKDIGDRTEAKRLRKVRQKWQQDAISYADVGEAKAALRYRANMISKNRLVPAWVERPGTLPVALDAVGDDGQPAADVPDAVRSLCFDIVARLDQSPSGIAGLLYELTYNFDVPGDCWLVGLGERPERIQAGRVIPAMDEVWEIKSIDEIEIKEHGADDALYVLKRPPKGIPDGVLTRDDFIARLWQSDPFDSEMADSPMRGVLDVLEEILILQRAARAWALSRLNAGFLKVPNSLTNNVPDPTQGAAEGGDRFSLFRDMLFDVMTTPIQQEGSASAVVPGVVFGEPDELAAFTHMTMDRPIDKELDARLEARVLRLARSLDVPPERVRGHTETTFANAATIDIDEFRGYLEPSVMGQCGALTSAYFRPMLEAAGVARDLRRQLVMWYDPSELVAEPDRRPTANDAYDRMVISDSTYRRETGYSEEDAPSDEEMERRLERRAVPAVPEPADEATAASAAPLAPTAAARPDVGRRLMEIDRSLRSRLESAADQAVRRALEKFGATVRSKTVSASKAAIEGVPNHLVPGTLGKALVAAIGLTEDELLESAFDSLHDEYDQRVRRAQRASLDVLARSGVLDEDERAELEAQQDEDRQSSWAWFLASLLGLARSRLFDPTPAATPGEFDSLATVPPGVVREAVARAGGAKGLESRGGALTTAGGTQPAGGIGTGQLVADTFARHGWQITGWEWVYGDPSSRQSNFQPHLDMDGREIKDWGSEDLSVGENTWLATTGLRPGDHPYCFPAGTVVSGPAARGATLRWYEGELVELGFASGQFLSATPNHPVLTRRGWVPAGGLVEGDEVVRCEGTERVAGLVPHNRQVPALIEDVVAAIGVTPGMVSGRVPVPPEQFHGDGVGSEVAVVWTDRELRKSRDASVQQPPGQDALVVGDADCSLVPGSGSTTQHLEGVGDPPLGGMGSLGVGLPLLGGKAPHSDEPGLTGAPALDASFVEPLVDGPTGYAEALGQSEARLARLVEFDKVVGVERKASHGYVHNLQTEVGWYLANGIVVHNCQCDIVPVYAEGAA